jgi:SAM-dependent methyltransferase/mannose-6-phosphate isomerase-like protein (cupin superfamily)
MVNVTAISMAAPEMKTTRYLYSLPTLTSFEGKGLRGYNFGPLKQRNLDIYYIEVEKGHDTFMVSKKITRTYYVLCGNGHFTIDNRRYDVHAGMLVEVPPKVEYSYSGKMKLIAFSIPAWFSGNDTYTKWNPDVVVQRDAPGASTDRSWLRRLIGRLIRLKIFGKSPVNAVLRLNRRLWDNLPVSFISLGPTRLYGEFLHTLACIHNDRGQAFATFFLRNRPQLELLRRLVQRWTEAKTLRVAVLGCSIGAEAYSVAWTIRSARPDLRLILQAVDISRKAVEVGKCGTYPLASEATNTDLFERMTEAEIAELFDRDCDVATVKPGIRNGIEWHAGDVGDPEMIDVLARQDIVVANNFLCHMGPAMAENCLRNIARLVKPLGYLFVSGIDLNVRTKVAKDLGWNPLQELLEEIHNGDPCMKTFWPWHYAGVEPLNKRRRDWRLRYAAAFEMAPSSESVIGNIRSSPAERHVSEVALVKNQPTRASAAS